SRAVLSPHQPFQNPAVLPGASTPFSDEAEANGAKRLSTAAESGQLRKSFGTARANGITPLERMERLQTNILAEIALVLRRVLPAAGGADPQRLSAVITDRKNVARFLPHAVADDAGSVRHADPGRRRERLDEASISLQCAV